VYLNSDTGIYLPRLRAGGSSGNENCKQGAKRNDRNTIEDFEKTLGRIK